MKKIMLIGSTGCGKTTFRQALESEDIHYKKTQAIEFTTNVIDTPGEYIENRTLYRALIISSADSDVIALVQDCTKDDIVFPPKFSSIFTKKIIGIITKIDMCYDDEMINKAEEKLIDAGVHKENIFKISSIKKMGIDDIKLFLEM